MDKDTADFMRGGVRRVTYKNIKDNGQTQTASIEVADGIWRDDVEVMQPYGLASHVPLDGGLAIAFAIGGDQGDMVIMPLSNPSKRLGKLAEGEIGLYNEHGDMLVIGADGAIKVQAGASMSFSVGGVSVTISAAGMTIAGGRVEHDGKNIGKDHRHDGVTAGAANTGEPIA